MASTLVDYWFFESLGYTDVFIKNTVTYWTLFAVGFLVTLMLMRRIITEIYFKPRESKVSEELSRLEEIRKDLKNRLKDSEPEDEHSTLLKEKLRRVEERISEINRSIRRFTIFGVVLVYLLPAVIFGHIFGSMYLTVLKFIHQTPFNRVDPIFGYDLSFYFFTLPFIGGLIERAFMLLILLSGVLIIGLLYDLFIEEKDDIEKYYKPMKYTVIATLILITVHFIVLQYYLVYSSNEVFYGAGATDLNVWRYALIYYAALSIIACGVICFSNKLKLQELYEKYKESNRKMILALVTLAVVLLLPVGATWMYQAFVVKPNELQIESPYIEYNIKFTRYGYNLDQIEVRDYSPTGKIDASILNSITVQNIRILDWKPLLTTLQETQALREYYHFVDVDTDRYYVNGTLRQVMITARELDTERLSPQAQTWVNKKLIYTHGYGVVVSPVNEIRNRLPVIWVGDIPPHSQFDELKVTQPKIYYGELTQESILTNTKEEEFDYPFGESNVKTTYQGDGGIVLSGIRRMVAATFDFTILISSYITKDSKLHIYRSIDERVYKIAPFLYWDTDPYIVINSNGELVWMISGMAGGRELPYSQPLPLYVTIKVEKTDKGVKIETIEEGWVNYIRDSVKCTIDPLNGEVKFYVINWDPLMQTYQKIYPSLFLDASEMPDDLRKHLKYPETLFSLQVKAFNKYHMTNVGTFYNKEDLWEMAKEKYHGEVTRVEPYNVILNIDGRTEFVMMEAVTPRNRDNMIAWIAVLQQPETYGKIICYRFPKGLLVYGPMQIEGLIDQDKELSKLMTLWGQQGSEVLRGNLLVIPIAGTIIYLEPIYISATEKSRLPELGIIVAVHRDPITGETRLGYGPSVEDALQGVIGEPNKLPVKVKEEDKTGTKVSKEDIMQLIEEIEQKLAELKKKLSESS